MTTLRILFIVAVAGTAVFLALGPARFTALFQRDAVTDATFREIAPPDLTADSVRETAPQPVFAEAAQRAWSYIDRAYDPATGMVRPVADYAFTTLWDVASALAAFDSAERLGLITYEEYESRTARLLGTLAELPLFDDAAFNKIYHVQDLAMGGRDGQSSARGYGWSATDLGRLLIWLHIIRTQRPALAGAAAAVAARLDFDRIVRDGMLHGAEGGRGRVRSYQEGRLGYEQYAAAGFALWGKAAGRAADWRAHARRVQVHDQPLLQDVRPHACLTSEPFFLLGLELGFDEHAFPLALGLLNAQRERWLRTGIVTLASEDASSDPPHYFHYYCVLFDDHEFAITAQGESVPIHAARTASTKAAFAWYALAPNSYTRLALDTVAAAVANAGGMPAGIYEGTSRSSGPENVNTAAVILEAAAFARSRRPLVRAAQ